MGNDTSNKKSKQQEPIDVESDLKSLYKQVYDLLLTKAESLKKQIDGQTDAAIKKLLEYNYQVLQDTLKDSKLESAITIVDGLEGILDRLSVKGTKTETKPAADKPYEPPKRIEAILHEAKPEAKTADCTDVAKYVAECFVQNPGQNKLYSRQIAKETGGNERTVRSYLRKGRLPLPAKNDSRTPQKLPGGKVVSSTPLYLENKTVNLESFVIPESVLAAWKRFGTLEEGELYLYTTPDKIDALRSAVEKYNGKLEISVPQLEPFHAFKYPYFRQLAKNEQLVKIFDHLLDEGKLNSEQTARVKELKSEQVLLHNWENAISQDIPPVVYFLTKDCAVTDDKRHLVKPVIELLRERGLFLAEIIQILDKPVSRVLHAVELLTGKDKTGCPYNLLDKSNQCLTVPKVVAAYSLPEGLVHFKAMPLDMREAYTECLRYGLQPKPENAKDRHSNFIANVDGQEYQLHGDGVYKGADKIALTEFSEILQSAYKKRIK